MSRINKKDRYRSDSVSVLRGRTLSASLVIFIQTWQSVDRAAIAPTRRRVTSLHLGGITSGAVISRFSKDFNRSVYEADGEKIGLADFPITDD